MMWWPIVVVPTAIPAGIARCSPAAPPTPCCRWPRRRSSSTACRAPTCTGGASRNAPAGSPATTWRPGRRCSRRCWPPWSAAWDCWPRCCAAKATAARRRLMPFRSPTPARRHPAGPGPVPRLRRPGPGRGLGRRHRRGGAGPARPARASWRSSPRHEVGDRRTAAGSAARPGHRTAGPGAGPDRRPPGGRRDRRLALRRPARGRPGLAGHPARSWTRTPTTGTAAASPQLTPASRPR